MPRRWRKDYPGAWHHVMDRGVARRTLFETRRDIRFFLACLARQVRSGDLEVHAYCVMTTHFHLLVRSPRGMLSRAMQRALDAYARWFNRGRRRDGPLFRGRFANRLVETEAYWADLLAYIDRNPVQAGLAARPSDYPHGSAFHFARAAGPPWLRRDEVEAWSSGFAQGVPYDPARYSSLAGRGTGDSWLVERRMAAAPPSGADPLDDLVGAAPESVRNWMERKARLGDGTGPGWVIAAPAAFRSALAARRSALPVWSVDLTSRYRAGWEAMEAGGLRWFCGLRVLEVSAMTGVPRTTTQQRVAKFVQACGASREFREMAAEVLATAIPARGGPRRGPPIVRVGAAVNSGGGGRVPYAVVPCTLCP